MADTFSAQIDHFYKQISGSVKGEKISKESTMNSKVRSMVASKLLVIAKKMVSEGTEKVDTKNDPTLNAAVTALAKATGGDLGQVLQAVFMVLRKTGNGQAVTQIKPLFQQVLNKAGNKS
jgi:hypothetical protein